MSLESRRIQAIASDVAVAINVFAKSASNAEIWDADGARHIDFAAGIAVVNTGHRNAKLVDAVHKLSNAFTHSCHQVVPYESCVSLAGWVITMASRTISRRKSLSVGMNRV